jgi:sulfide:quinone oxidoreductase
MARVVILGAGVAGHTAALHAKRILGKTNEIIVISPNSKYNWIPSNIWVGVGKMSAEQVSFPLAPIYEKQGIEFHQALAQSIHPQGDSQIQRGYVQVSYTSPEHNGEIRAIEYDYLVNATGPKLNFAATPGLGPDGHTVSVCTFGHAIEAAKSLKEIIAVLKTGKRQTIAVGVGHGTCTCEGAAFEYTFNVDHELRDAGVRDLADIYYITNEYELGDFGVGGLTFAQQGFQTSSKIWTESLFRERNIKAILGAHVEKVEAGIIHYELVDGTKDTLDFNFAMLLPPFRGVDLKAFAKDGADISEKIFAPNGFMKVDADYTAKPYEEWLAADWPKTYRNPLYPNIFAVGIAFAPPHQISKPRKSPNGTLITPSPPRTGMPSGIMGKLSILSIKELIQNGAQAQVLTASMADMGAACVASAGSGLRKGSAASMTMYPVVPDYIQYPDTGRSMKDTFGEIGLAGHWIKLLLHYMFIYKAKARFGWFLIPE